MSRKKLRRLSVTANPDVTGSLWHAARDVAQGYAWTLCGWLVIAHRLKEMPVTCPKCLARLNDLAKKGGRP